MEHYITFSWAYWQKLFKCFKIFI